MTAQDPIALVLKAAAFAAEKHSHQRRKDIAGPLPEWSKVWDYSGGFWKFLDTFFI